MNETQNFPFIPTPALTKLLPTLMMLLYGCARHGAVTVDRENHTISIEQFSYDVTLIDRHLSDVQLAIASYEQQCQLIETNGNPNDISMLYEIYNILLETKTWLQ
jgi:hypothetical protein